MTKKSCKYVFADVSLLAVAAIWGLTFVTVKNAIVLLPPFAFNFYRFGLAALVMLLVAIPQRHRIELTTVKAGFLLGIFLFAGYSFQTVGLFYTSASNTGFITGLSVVCVPLFSTLISKAWPGMGVVIGAVSATIGLFFISGGSVSNFNIGDFLVLFCAISFALHIIFVGKFAVLHSTVWLVTVQIATVSLLSGISTLFLEAGNNTFVSAVWPALVITALFATCFAFFIQNLMQRFTTPSHTAIMFTSEPVFAAFFAVWLLQETLTSTAYWGGAFIVAGMLLSELRSLPFFEASKDPLPIQGQQE